MDKAEVKQRVQDAFADIVATALELDGETYLSQALLQTAVANAVFPDGVNDEAAYAQVVNWAEQVAAHHGFVESVTLTPPRVPFGRAGRYWRRLPELTQELVTTLLADLTPWSSRTAPEQTLVRRDIIAAVTTAVHGAAAPSASHSDLADVVDAHMTALGWTPDGDVYRQALTGDGVAAETAVVTFLQTQSCAVTFHQLLAEAAQAAYGKPYRTYGREQEPWLAALKPVVLKAVQTANYHEESDHVFAPRPLPMPDDLPQQIELAVDNATPTTYVWRGSSRRMLLAADIERVVKRCLPEPVSDYHWQQQLQPLIAHALAARGFKTRKQQIRSEKLTPQPATAAHWLPVYEHTVSERVPDDHTVCLGDRTTMPAVWAPIAVIDERVRELICLRLVGPLQAVKANWTKVVGGSSSGYRLLDTYLRGRKAVDYTVVKATLPIGWADWIILHKQAGMATAQPEQPVYVLVDEKDGVVPRRFFPLLNCTLGTPLQPHWATYLWRMGVTADLIQPAAEHAVGWQAWRVAVSADAAWDEILSAGLRSGHISMRDEAGNAIVQPDNDLISRYTVDDALDDGTLLPTWSPDSPLNGIGTTNSSFPLGTVVMKPGAAEMGETIDLLTYLKRHAACDWGDVDAADARTNDQALRDGLRLLSAYETSASMLWIISESDRSVTTLLTPGEY